MKDDKCSEDLRAKKNIKKICKNICIMNPNNKNRARALGGGREILKRPQKELKCIIGMLSPSGIADNDRVRAINCVDRHFIGESTNVAAVILLFLRR